MRHIVECGQDASDMIVGMKAIKWLKELCEKDPQQKDGIITFNDGSVWYVKKTKTGYSARTRSYDD